VPLIKEELHREESQGGGASASVERKALFSESVYVLKKDACTVETKIRGENEVGRGDSHGV